MKIMHRKKKKPFTKKKKKKNKKEEKEDQDLESPRNSRPIVKDNKRPKELTLLVYIYLFLYSMVGLLGGFVSRCD